MIQSVDRAIRIINKIAENAQYGIPLSRLSNELGLNVSTVRHLAETLINHKILEQDPASKYYRLGINLIRLGNEAHKSTNLVSLSAPYLEKVWYETGQSVALMAFTGLLRIPLSQLSGQQYLIPKSAPLEISTLHATGSGKLLLAYLSSGELDSYLKNNRLDRFTRHTLSDEKELRDELVKIRQASQSLDREEYGLGVACIAVPILDASNRCVGCIDLVYPIERAKREDHAKWLKVMTSVGQELSAYLKDVDFSVSR